MQFSDEKLVEETLSGSHFAFDQLMQRYEGLVYWISFSWTKNHESSLDLCQDIFLKSFRKLAAFNGTGIFKSWLSSIAVREGSNWSRKNKKHLGHSELTDEIEPSLLPSQETHLLEQEKIKQLVFKFNDLSPRQRLAISLRYFERMPTKDIAQVLDCSEGVAKNILFRSVQKLRKNLNTTRENTA